MIKKLWLMLAYVLLAVPVYAQSQGEFLPADKLPPSDQLPAAPLLIAAYAFAWLAVFFYLWTVWRRLGNVERDMRALERRQSERGQPR
jgi:CcmD family protein